jgi:hypothetical protein
VTIKERLLTQVLPLILGLITFWGGWKLMFFGFEEIQQLRTLERTPIVSLQSLIPGPNTVSGFAEVSDASPVKSYHTNTPSLYYRYTHEVERRDSDGNTYWELATEKIESVNFNLRDHSGVVPIQTTQFKRWIDWSVEMSFRTVTGDHRYTEWRIEPNDKLFIYGYAQSQPKSPNQQPPNQLTIDFIPFDGYTPIISTFDKSYEQQRMGSTGIFFLWGGLALIAMSIYALAVIIRVHKLWKYQTLLIVSVSLVLVHFSLLMMKNDLGQAIKRYQQQWQYTVAQLENAHEHLSREYLSEVLSSSTGQFSTTSNADTDNLALNEYKLNLALSFHLIEQQLTRFPEWLFAPTWGYSLKSLPKVSLNPIQRQRFSQRLTLLADSRLSNTSHYVFFILGLILMAICSYFGFKKIKYKRLIENIPTQKTLGLVPGMAEVNGTMTLLPNTQPLESPLTFSECCWYHYTVKEKRGSGKNSKWVTIVDDQQGLDFLCEDDEGSVKVLNEHAEIITEHNKSRTAGNRSYSERVLKIGDPLYVIGEAKPQPAQQDKLQITEAGSKLPFIISNLPESRVMFRKAWLGLLLLNFAFTGIVISGLLWFAQSGSFSPSDFLAAALFGPIYMLCFSMMLHYNDIIYLKQRAERNWVNMGVAIRKRKDLIPSLETLVKGYLKHEQTIMEEVAQFRSSILSSTEDQASFQTCMDNTQKLNSSINLLIEQYPDMRGKELILQLMKELSRLDTELALLKNGYNDAVTLYNERIESFPDIVFTWLFKFKPAELFA